MDSFLPSLFPNHPTQSTIYTALAVGATLGILLPESRTLLAYIRLHFLSRSNLHLYRHPPTQARQSLDQQRSGGPQDSNPWAVITGASDGIGYGFVQELASQGFNIILHGRNQAKIDGLIEGLRKQWPDRSYESFICDATNRASLAERLDSLVKWLDDYSCNLTILVNNIGGNPYKARSFTPLAQYSVDELTALVDFNVTFPVQITRALLPTLQRNKPSLIINMASATGTSNITIPYLATYSGGKAFNRQFSKSLRLEMIATDHEGVEVMSVVAAKVQSGGMRTETGWAVPSSRDFARSTLHKVGCGRAEVTPWWGQSLQLWSMGLLPDWMREKVLVDVGKQEKREMEEVWKKES